MASAKFITQAQAEVCAERHNRLYVIDQQYVFWDRASNCGDNSYAYRLYGSSPEVELCSQTDSIIGPQTKCKDDKSRQLFETLVANRDAPGLGLGEGHKIEKLSFDGQAEGFVEIDNRAFSGITERKQVVVKDVDSWIALWRAHAGADVPVPKVDFNSRMVLAVFSGYMSGCSELHIDTVVRKAGKLVVSYSTRNGPRSPEVACIAAMVPIGHLVEVDRTDLPVEFVITDAK
ncbi:MAG: hypothetical protein ACLGI6_19775 [Gammaproteobacteria bacterium]